jgi:hypothetical protein
MNTRFVLLSVCLVGVAALCSTPAAAREREEPARLGEGAEVMPASIGRAEIFSEIRRRQKMKKCRLQCWSIQTGDRSPPRINCRMSCQN